MFRRKFLLASLFSISLAAVACSQGGDVAGTANNKDVAGTANNELVMGLIPAENNEEMIDKFEPMRAYLEQKLGRPVKVFTATDYAGVIEAMRQDRVDVAWFGPLSYILAEKEAGAEAFAVGVTADGTSTYHSIFVVPGDSPLQSIKDLQGKNVALVDPASTSGGLVPRFMVSEVVGKKPEDFFGKLTYAGSHDAAGLAVKNGTVDAAAMSEITYRKMLKEGLITPESVRILVKSEALPGSPLVYRSDLDEDTKTKIRDVILNAHNDIEVTGYGEILRYEAATPADYDLIRSMVSTLGLSREEMLK
ncbi:phosphonate ABC transporter substrate-binding protein [Synechococcus sp. PCC 6716]|nr:phosphonate ABC transporter substrate-binding protein [Synechococcus sp. PCC 6716]